MAQMCYRAATGSPLTVRRLDMVDKLDPAGLAARINAKVERSGDCLLWTGSLRNGQPEMRIAGRKASVARVVWGLKRYDDAPPHIAKTCGNKLCVAVEHLADAAEIVEVEDRVASLDWSALDDRTLAALRRQCGWLAQAYGWDADDVLQEACICFAAYPDRGVRFAVRTGASVARRRTLADEPVEMAGLFRDEIPEG